MPRLYTQVGSLMQFIGEVDVRGAAGAAAADDAAPRLVVRARVARCVDGMDLSLYEEALSVRRQFEATQAART